MDSVLAFKAERRELKNKGAKELKEEWKQQEEAVNQGQMPEILSFLDRALFC